MQSCESTSVSNFVLPPRSETKLIPHPGGTTVEFMSAWHAPGPWVPPFRHSHA